MCIIKYLKALLHNHHSNGQFQTIRAKGWNESTINFEVDLMKRGEIIQNKPTLVTPLSPLTVILFIVTERGNSLVSENNFSESQPNPTVDFSLQNKMKLLGSDVNKS